MQSARAADQCKASNNSRLHTPSEHGSTDQRTWQCITRRALSRFRHSSLIARLTSLLDMASHRRAASISPHLRGGLIQGGALLLRQRPSVSAALLRGRRRPRRLRGLLLLVDVLQVALPGGSRGLSRELHGPQPAHSTPMPAALGPDLSQIVPSRFNIPVHDAHQSFTTVLHSFVGSALMS